MGAAAGAGKSSAPSGRGSSVPTGRRSSPNRTAAPTWLVTALDAFAAAEKSFTPENARKVVEVMDHFPDLLEGLASFAESLGKQSVEHVALPPSTQDMFLKLGEFQRKSVGPARTGLMAARKSVQDEIDRYERNDRREAAWDVRANN